MNCPDTQTRFDERLDDRLPAADRVAFDDHLAGCSACRQEWQAYARAWETLGQHVAPEPSWGFADRVRRRLDEPVHTPARWPVWRWVTVGAAVVVVGAAGLTIVQRMQQARLARLYAELHQDDYLDDFDVIANLDQIEGASPL